MASVPPSVPVDGRLRVWWVPTIADTAAPTVAEITAGVDITCYLNESKVGVSKDQSTIADRRMCNTTALQIPGSGTATADDVTYIYDPQAEDADPMNVAFDELAEGSEGHYVVRRGVAYETEATAGQNVEVQSTTNGVRWDSSNATEDFSKMTQRRFLTNFVEKATVAA
jgi:hypothetical protein